MDEGNAKHHSRRRRQQGGSNTTQNGPSRRHRHRSSVEPSHAKRQRGRNKEQSSPMAIKSKKKGSRRVSLEEDRLDSEGEVAQLTLPNVEPEYIRNTISLPAMNNTAEELIIDGFAIVSFLTKEDLDVSLN